MCASGVTTVLAGCPDYPAASRLALDNLAIQETDSGYVLDFVVENHNVRHNAEADFHDVSVVGYTKDGKVVCRKHIGNVTHEFDNNDGKPVALECSDFPHIITFTAAESPCEDDVIINIAVYNDQKDNWLVDRYSRECDEGLPPNPRE